MPDHLRPRYLPLAVLLVLPMLPGCGSAQPPPKPTPYVPDVPIAEACAHLRTLRCREGDPTPKGATCEEVYTSINASGLARFPSGCVVRVATCAEAKACR